MTNKEIISIAAVVISLVAFYPYIRAILRGTIKPHMFSWIIWGATTCIVFFAQLADHAGAGAWSTGVTGLITFYVAWLAYIKRTDHSISTLDWMFFAMAIGAIGVWYLTSDPLWAVVVLMTVDLLGFCPTIRKAYLKPFEESLLFFNLMTLRNVFSIAALEHLSLTTYLFPLMIAISSMMFVVMVMVRRQVLK